MPGLAARKTAAAMLRRVIESGTALDSLLSEGQESKHFQALGGSDRALVRAILGAALRRRGEIESAIAERLDRPLPPGSETVSAILHVAAAQILFLDIPDHAAVNLAVAHASRERNAHQARGLVNGVLRRIARERQSILERPGAELLNTPAWLLKRWSDAYGEGKARTIAAAHVTQPPLDLSAKADPEMWAGQLGGTLLPTGSIRLADPHRITELPGFAEGAWWVQDAAASLPARLLGDVTGKAVADLCAAPGGKTAELAVAGANVTAIDISPNRLKRLAENLARLGLKAELQAADILAWTPERQFEAVLLDAPCTATGTIRRHPDIAWLKRPENIVSLSELQSKLLDRAAEIVSPGGVLVFATCSLEPEECDGQAAPFLARHPDFRLEPIDPAEVMGLGHLLTPAGLLRTLPCHGFGEAPAMQGMDGFFAVRFRRR